MTVSNAEESFRDYVRVRLVSLGRTAYLLTGDAHLAEDLVQQTLIRVASHWERIVAGGDPDPYVRRTLYTQAVSWWRQRHREATEPRETLPDRSCPDPSRDIDTSLALRQALARLTPKQRAVLVLRFYEDLSEAQTAEVLHIATGTVKSQTRDALARLRLTAPELVELKP